MFLFLWGAATATLESFDYHKCEDGSYTINSLPFEIGTRTDFEQGKHLFIRPCYRDMAEVFFKSMSATRPYVVVPFIGTAGIGKSCLFLFILMEWFEREGQPQSFYYQTTKDKISVFEATVDGKFQVSTIATASTFKLNANMPLFVDMKEQSLPEVHYNTFIFSSFQPKRYKEITKGMPQYVMPTWAGVCWLLCFGPLLDRPWTRQIIGPQAGAAKCRYVWWQSSQRCYGCAAHAWRKQGNHSMQRLRRRCRAKGLVPPSASLKEDSTLTMQLYPMFWFTATLPSMKTGITCMLAVR